MKAKSMILIVIALGCGLVASIGISQVIDKKNQGGDVPVSESTKIFVTTVDIPIGDPLTAEMVRLEEWPKDRVPEGCITKLEEIVDRRPRSPLYAGEPIMAAKLINGNERGGITDRIPDGYRVSSVKVDLSSSVSGLILPGDRVDVICSFRRSADIPEPLVETILEQATVFAVNEQTTREADRDVTVIAAKTVSLLLTPRQDKMLLLASELGRLQLSLRGAGDEALDTDGGVTIAELLGREHDDAGFRVSTEDSENDSSLVDLLNQNDSEVAQEEPKSFEMQIITPGGVTSHSWNDVHSNSLPDEFPSPRSETNGLDPSEVSPEDYDFEADDLDDLQEELDDEVEFDLPYDDE